SASSLGSGAPRAGGSRPWPMPRPPGRAGQIAGSGLGLFPVMTGFVLLVWVLWWVARLGEGWEKAVPRSREAVARAGTLIWWPVLMWGVLEWWRADGAGVGLVSRNVWVLAGIGISGAFLVGLVLFATGRDTMRVCLFSGQAGWWVASWERMIWWGFMVVLHLFLLELCAVSAAAVLDTEAVTGFVWSVFLSLLRGAVYVWLLGALAGLVIDTKEKR
ncbi:MAG: hypothetical protein AAF591_16060, partial [Verrucomicrobiota bacterium]